MLGFYLFWLIHGLYKTLDQLVVFSIYFRIDCGYIVERVEVKTENKSEKFLVKLLGPIDLMVVGSIECG